MADRFVDTSGWAEWADKSLLFHTRARTSFDEVWKQGGRLVTTNLVLAELTALLTSPLRVPKRHQVILLDGLHSDPSVEVVPFDPTLEAATWNLWRSRQDKTWSLVDCASFVVMRHRNVSEAITTDHHFEQAGFVRILR